MIHLKREMVLIKQAQALEKNKKVKTYYLIFLSFLYSSYVSLFFFCVKLIQEPQTLTSLPPFKILTYVGCKAMFRFVTTYFSCGICVCIARFLPVPYHFTIGKSYFLLLSKFMLPPMMHR